MSKIRHSRSIRIRSFNNTLATIREQAQEIKKLKKKKNKPSIKGDSL